MNLFTGSVDPRADLGHARGVEPRFVARYSATSVSPGRVAALSQFLASSAAPPIAVATATIEGDGIVRGAFESNTRSEDGPIYRRASGGRSVRLSAGCVYIALALPHPSAAGADVNGSNLLNRLLRPLLKALTGEGALAHYFGRDWIAVQKRPAGTVAFAHQRGGGRTVVEAFLGISQSVALAPSHPSYLGKVPDCIERLAGRPLLDERVAERIAHAYAVSYGFEWTPHEWPALEAPRLGREPPWQATVEEPIGVLGARRDEGALRLGGELMISHDVLAGLTTWLDSAHSEADIDEALATCLSGQEVALFGVRDLAAIKRLVLALPRGGA